MAVSVTDVDNLIKVWANVLPKKLECNCDSDGNTSNENQLNWFACYCHSHHHNVIISRNKTDLRLPIFLSLSPFRATALLQVKPSYLQAKMVGWRVPPCQLISPGKMLRRITFSDCS